MNAAVAAQDQDLTVLDQIYNHADTAPSLDLIQRFRTRALDQKSFEEYLKTLPADAASEIDKIKRVLADPFAPIKADLGTHGRQLAWAAALGFLYLNLPPDSLRSHGIWTVLTHHKDVAGALTTAARYIDMSITNRGATIDWGTPGSWFWFSPDTNHINIDLFHTLATGFETIRMLPHVLGVMMHEVGHSELTKRFTDRMKELHKRQKELQEIGEKRKLTRDEYKELTMTAQEFQLRMNVFNAAEDNCVNRYSANLSKDFPHDFGASLNIVNVILQGSGMYIREMAKNPAAQEEPADPAHQEVLKAQKAFDTLNKVLALAFYTSNGLFDADDVETWKKLGVDPATIIADKSPEELKKPSSQSDFEKLIEMSVGLRGLANLQPSATDRWKLRSLFRNSVQSYADKRCALIDEIWNKYAARHAKVLMKAMEEQLDQAMDQAQQQQQNQPQDGQSQDQQQSGGSSSGNDKNNDPLPSQGSAGDSEGKEKDGEEKDKNQKGKDGAADKKEDGQDAENDKGDGKPDQDDQKQDGQSGSPSSSSSSGGSSDGSSQEGSAGGKQKPDGEGKNEGKGKVQVEGVGEMPAEDALPETPEEARKQMRKDAEEENKPNDKTKTVRALVQVPPMPGMSKPQQKQQPKNEDDDKPAPPPPNPDDLKINSSNQGGKQKGIDLAKLATRDWSDFKTRINELEPIIARIAEDFEYIRNQQNQPVRSLSKEREKLPRGGEIRERLDMRAHINMAMKRASGQQIDDYDRRRWKTDQVTQEPSSIEVWILGDGSGSMLYPLSTGGKRIDSAVQSMAILYEAAKRANFETFVGMWGDDEMRLLAEPGDDEKKVGQQFHKAQKGINSGTDLSPSFAQAIERSGKQETDSQGRQKRFAGMTHFLILSDGELNRGDMAPTTLLIKKLFRYGPSVSIDIAIIGSQGKEMMQVINEVKRENPGVALGVIHADDAATIPLLLAQAIKRRFEQSMGNLKATPDVAKREAFMQAHKAIITNFDIS